MGKHQISLRINAIEGKQRPYPDKMLPYKWSNYLNLVSLLSELRVLAASTKAISNSPVKYSLLLSIVFVPLVGRGNVI